MRVSQSSKRQRGVTAIGWIFLLAPVAVVGYAAIRLVTPYSNYFSLVRALEGFAKDNVGNTELTKVAVGDLLSRRFVTEYIEKPSIDQIDIVKNGSGWTVSAEYEEVVPLFFNVSLLLDFRKSVDVQ
jgi:hypothetical protein